MQPNSIYYQYHKEIEQFAKDLDYNHYQVAKALWKHIGKTGKPSGAICRYCKKIVKGFNVAKQELNEKGVSFDEFKHGWIKTKQGSYFIKNDKIIDYDQIREQFIEDVKEYAPKYPVIKHIDHEDKNLLVLDIADLHIDKLTSEYETGEKNKSIEDFKKELFGKIKTLIHRTSNFDISHIVFVGGNDVLHVDNPHNTTTSGTRQDVSMMWFDAFVEARKLYVEVIEYLMQIAPVHFVFVPSNHDYMSGFHLAQNIEAWFNNTDQVTFDVSPAHRKYFQYGNSLIGLTHGDGAKEVELPDLMKIEAKEAYSISEYCYWYTHHIHHKDKSNYKGKQKVRLEKDYRDVKVIHTGKNIHKQPNRTHVEYLRSGNGTDSWHHRNGYQHTPRGIEVFIHNLEDGQIGSFFA